MNAPLKSKLDLLRERDGNLCWLCQLPIDFKAAPNSAKAPSIEHLIPQCREGPKTLENLVLFHPPCNRQLKDRPLTDKINMRDKRRRKLWRSQLREKLDALLGR